MTTRSKTQNAALKLCVTAMFAALLVAGKTALAAIPNVEVVTLFVALCAYVWGIGIALPAVCAFIAVDVAIWGVNTWIISYLIHWNVLALSFWLLSKFPMRKKALLVVCVTFAAVFMAVCFGVLTTAVDTFVGFTGQGFFVDFESFGKRFAAMYVAGITFFVTQTVANAVLFATVFVPLVHVNRKAKLRLFGDSSVQQSPQPDDVLQQEQSCANSMDEFASQSARQQGSEETAQDDAAE